MGLPVPGIFLYKEAKTNKHLVIDGQQRLRSLQSFFEGYFGEKRFRLQNVLKAWNNKTYEDLDPADQLKLDDSIIHATIFTQDQPEDVLDSIYFVFERINSGGIRLSPQEIRNCIAIGPFISMVKGINMDEHWRKVFGGPVNKRAKDEELIVRFFAMLDKGGEYYRPMSKFLNDYSASMNLVPERVLEDHRELFRKTIELFDSALNGRAFRPARSLNAAVFDAVMVGLASRLLKRDDPTLESIAMAYDTLLADQGFRKGWVRATADEENVKNRMTAAIKAFDAI